MRQPIFIGSHAEFVRSTMDTVRDVYVKELNDSALDNSISRMCYGCIHNHPSQTQHDVCLMMDRQEQIDYVLQDALKHVCEMKIQFALEAVWGANFLVTVSDSLRFLLLHPESRVVLKKCKKWKDSLRPHLI